MGIPLIGSIPKETSFLLPDKLAQPELLAPGRKPVGNVKIENKGYKSTAWLLGGNDGFDVAGTDAWTTSGIGVASTNHGQYRRLPINKAIKTSFFIKNNDSFTAMVKFRPLAGAISSNGILSTGDNNVNEGMVIQVRTIADAYWIFFATTATYEFIEFSFAEVGDLYGWHTIVAQYDATTNTSSAAIDGKRKELALSNPYDGIMLDPLTINDYANRDTTTSGNDFEVAAFFETCDIDIVSLSLDPYQFLKPVTA